VVALAGIAFAGGTVLYITTRSQLEAQLLSDLNHHYELTEQVGRVERVQLPLKYALRLIKSRRDDQVNVECLVTAQDADGRLLVNVSRHRTNQWEVLGGEMQLDGGGKVTIERLRWGGGNGDLLLIRPKY
jgi:biotin-(acetyl-CoA carboxylase) ligase